MNYWRSVGQEAVCLCVPGIMAGVGSVVTDGRNVLLLMDHRVEN